MLKTTLFAAALCVAFALAGCESQQGKHARGDVHDDDHTTEVVIPLDQVPASVRQGFEREFPGAQVKRVEKETYRSGLVHYEFEFTTRDGKQMEVEFDEDGDLLPEH